MEGWIFETVQNLQFACVLGGGGVLWTGSYQMCLSASSDQETQLHLVIKTSLCSCMIYLGSMAEAIEN